MKHLPKYELEKMGMKIVFCCSYPAFPDSLRVEVCHRILIFLDDVPETPHPLIERRFMAGEFLR